MTLPGGMISKVSAWMSRVPLSSYFAVLFLTLRN